MKKIKSLWSWYKTNRVLISDAFKKRLQWVWNNTIGASWSWYKTHRIAISKSVENWLKARWAQFAGWYNRIPWVQIGKRTGYGIAGVWHFCVTHPRVAVSLLGAALLEVFIAFGGVPLWYWVSTLKRPTISTEANWLWWVVGGIAMIPVLALIIANRKKIWTPGAPSAKAWWWIGGIIAAIAAIYGLTKVPYGKIGGGVGDFFSVVPLWLYIVGPIVITIVIMVMRDGKTPNEKVKKVVDLFMALTKLAMFVAIFLFFLVFIIGPREFWGSYEMSPEVAAMAPSRQTQTVNAPVIPVANIGPFTRTAPVGTTNTPLEQWSATLQLNGRRFNADVAGANTVVPMAVWADGVVHIIAPGLRPNIGAPQQIRFLSLTNFPLTIRGTVE